MMFTISKHKSLHLLFVSTVISLAFSQTTLETMKATLERGDYAEAAFITGPRLVVEQPNLAEAHYLYAYALYLTNNHTQAEQELESAFSQSNNVPAEYHHLDGLLCAAMGLFREAQGKLEDAFKQHSSYDYAMDWGRMAWQAGDAQTALNAYEAALNAPDGQDKLWPYLNQGRIYQGLGELEPAINAFETFTQLYEGQSPRPEEASPAYIEAYYRLGSLYERSGDIQTAMGYYEIASINDASFQPAADALARLEQSLQEDSSP